MSAIYDNWERLVDVAVKKQQLWELFHQPATRSPSIFSEDSDSNSSFRNSGPAGSSSIPLNWPPKLVVVSDYWHGFHVNDAALDSVELLETGTFGRSYVASMDDGRRFVAKRLLKRMMEIVGDVRHQNVVALRAYYSSPV